MVAVDAKVVTTMKKPSLAIDRPPRNVSFGVSLTGSTRMPRTNHHEMASIAAAVRIMAGTIPFTPSHQYIGTVRANPATAPATFAFAILPIMRRPCSRASCPSCKLVSSRTTETRTIGTAYSAFPNENRLSGILNAMATVMPSRPVPQTHRRRIRMVRPIRCPSRDAFAAATSLTALKCMPSPVALRIMSTIPCSKPSTPTPAGPSSRATILVLTTVIRIVRNCAPPTIPVDLSACSYEVSAPDVFSVIPCCMTCLWGPFPRPA